MILIIFNPLPHLSPSQNHKPSIFLTFWFVKVILCVRIVYIWYKMTCWHFIYRQIMTIAMFCFWFVFAANRLFWKSSIPDKLCAEITKWTFSSWSARPTVYNVIMMFFLVGAWLKGDTDCCWRQVYCTMVLCPSSSLVTWQSLWDMKPAPCYLLCTMFFRNSLFLD